MNSPALKLDPRDNAAVALQDLPAGATVTLNGDSYRLPSGVAAKHKFACEDFPEGAPVRLYGVLVGKTTRPVARGESLTRENLAHDAAAFSLGDSRQSREWATPDVSEWSEKTFLGFHRADGAVGTANHWIVIPMVFCENRNIDVMRQAMQRALGFHTASPYEAFASSLVSAFREGTSEDDLRALNMVQTEDDLRAAGASGSNSLPAEASREGRGTFATLDPRPFHHLDGLHFLSHGLGCGGTREDAQALCALLAGYVTHPNVAGATVLSLGCQNAEVSILEEEIHRRSPNFDKPLLIYEQQRISSEKVLMESAIRDTFVALTRVDRSAERKPATLDKLTIGVECGASDGFSGISANPAIGHAADLVTALGGKTILSEFPELCGVEQELIDRCVSAEVAQNFIDLMRAYNARAEAVGSAFSMNPSPGNIRDGLITDAIKSAGAAKKGGTSPVTDVVDYPGWATKPGLTLLCTPGNDVESTTALAAAQANLILFSTGLGTPTGNPVAPVIKVSSNSATSEKFPDMIDFDAGPIIEGSESIAVTGEKLLSHCIDVASGTVPTKASLLGQYDFLPWKRGVSL